MFSKQANRISKDKKFPFYSYYFLLFFLFFVNLNCNDYLFYRPDSQIYLPPEKLGLQYKDFFLKGIDQNRIHTWLFPTPSRQPFGTVVQLHGNAQNISSHYTSLLWLYRQGFELLTFDYRGYGRSDGKVNTGKIIADIKLVLEFIQKRNKRKEIPVILYGQSLGGILMPYALAEMKRDPIIRAAVIEGSFSSYQDLGKEIAGNILFPLRYLAGLLISDRYAVRESLPKLSPLHTIVVHGSADSVVPYSHGKEVFKLLRKPKSFLEIPEGGHLNWHHIEKYEKERMALLKIIKASL